MRIKRPLLLLAAAIVLAVPTASIFQGVVFADYPKLNNRSLTIGTTEPGEATEYVFTWRWPTNTSVGSVRFLLCLDAYVTDPCSSTPNGDFSGAILTNQTGALGGFNVYSQTANELIIGRGSSGNTGTGQYSFEFDDVVNPTGTHHRFYVQIFSYTSIDGSGIPTHMSSVATATATPIMINTEVPQILYFCAGLTVTEWCADVSGNFIDYGDLSSDFGHNATSQFGVATNATGGYVVTINGNTMASGNKLIEPLSIPSAFATGVPQFGLNLRANTNPANGQDVTGVGVGVVATDYDTPDLFKYADGDMVALATTGTMFNTYTVTYIVNIPPDQPSGIYNTTIAYICTAAF